MELPDLRYMYHNQHTMITGPAMVRTHLNVTCQAAHLHPQHVMTLLLKMSFDSK